MMLSGVSEAEIMAVSQMYKLINKFRESPLYPFFRGTSRTIEKAVKRVLNINRFTSGRTAIQKYRNFYNGQRCLIIGNGQKDEEAVVFPLDLATEAFIEARHYADEHGIKILNATRGGKLEVFEKVNFDSLFADK